MQRDVHGENAHKRAAMIIQPLQPVVRGEIGMEEIVLGVVVIVGVIITPAGAQNSILMRQHVMQRRASSVNGNGMPAKIWAVGITILQTRVHV